MRRLVVEDVSKTFGVNGTAVRAVDRVTFAVDAGEFVSIIGHSGSGKTTLLSIVGGLCRPTSGRVLLDGTDLGGLDSDGLAAYRCEKVGFVFQFASLLPALTALENLLLPLGFRPGRPRAEEGEAKARELLGLMGLSEKAHALPSQLSGGQQRRVAIARAFMNDPTLILADEPTGDLDEETEAEVMAFFRAMNRRRGAAFVMVTHDLSLAAQAGRQLRMHRGRMVELASPANAPQLAAAAEARRGAST
ncbi:MAG TPA: ABC transporter ATP-binding protein [Anaeromyxobacter sp.]|nr:ABC transporter ATP-binding protein [Anaeromyxobacter sp.]